MYLNESCASFFYSVCTNAHKQVILLMISVFGFVQFSDIISSFFVCSDIGLKSDASTSNPHSKQI